jgi:DNA repair protein RadA/Sms
MARNRTSYICGNCGVRTPQWQGQCPACEAWNTLEIAVSSIASGGVTARARSGGSTATGAALSRTLAEVAQERDERAATGIGELDRVLGGGLVAGSVVLLGGDPGIGKSTLLLQAADALSRTQTVLYVSGEESARQVASRAQRLGLEATALRLAAETRIETILDDAVTVRASVVVID